MPNLTLDFVAMAGVLDPRITFTRNSVGTYFDSVGNLQTATANVPRFGYDPVTLQPLGLLAELASTNTIQNSACVGAVAGTPGTQPNLWNVDTTGNGLTRTIVGVGTENNIDFVDIRFVGTPVATIPISIAYSGLNAVVGTPSQNQGFSCFYRLMAGSVAGCVFNQCISASDGAAYLGDSPGCVVFVPTNDPLRTQRPQAVGTLAAFAATTRVVNRLRVDVTIGVPVDFTIRIGMPQNDSSAVLSTPIRTTVAGLGRVVEVAFMDAANFTSWYEQGPGTITMDYLQQNQVNGNAWAVSDNTTANSMRQAANVANTSLAVTVGGALQANPSVNTPGKLPYTPRWFSAAAWETNNVNIAVNGVLGTPDTSATIPLVQTHFRIATQETGVTGLGGSIRKITYVPRRLTDNELVALTSDRALWVGGVLVADKPAIRISSKPEQETKVETLDFAMNFEDSEQSEADKKLMVVFFKDVIKNETKSTEAGRPIFDEIDLVKIITPGSRDSFVGDATPPYQARFPKQWDAYKRGNSQEVSGTPLSQLPWLGIGQIAEFNAMGCRTVEQLVGMSDANAHKFMGYQAIKERAKAYLAAASDAAPLLKMEAELTKRDGVIKQMQETMAAMQAEIAASKAGKK